MSNSVTHYANIVNKSNNLLNTKMIMNMNITNPPLYPTATSTMTTLSNAVKVLNYKNIAPAPPPSATTTEYKAIAPAPIDVGVKSRKYTQRAVSTPPYGVDQTQSVQRRNARERNRVKQVNNSFSRLRQHLPQYIVSDLTKGGGRGPHKKISKVDTLRIAVEYIRRLEYLVEDLGGNEPTSETANSSNSETFPTSDVMQSQVYYSTSTSPPQTEFPQQTITLQLQHQQQHQQQQQHQPQHQQQHQPQQLHQQQQEQPQQETQQNSPLFHQNSFPSTLLTPISLGAFSPVQTKIDMPCHSPTASYISNTSFDSGTYEPTHQLSPEPYNDVAADIKARNNTNLALKFEPYDNFRLDEEGCTPDDDEIIDYISLWQEEQQASHN